MLLLVTVTTNSNSTSRPTSNIYYPFWSTYCHPFQPGHYSSLTAPKLQPTANQEQYDQCHNQHYSRELLMMGIVMLETCWAYSLQPGHYSSLTAPNLQPTANQEQHDQCGKQHYSRELLMMGTVVPETCWAYKKYNKVISGILLVFYSSVITMMHGPTNIKYYIVWMFFFSFSQHAMRMRHTVICGLSDSIIFFPHYLVTGKIVGKKKF